MLETRKKKILKILVIMLVIFTLGLLGTTVFLMSQKNKEVSTAEKMTADNRKEYLDLIARQEKASKESTFKPDSTTPSIKARGKSNVKIILIRPAQISGSSIGSLASRLKSGTSSLNYIPTYLTKQAEKYNINDFQIELDILGPYVLKDLPYVGDIMNYWGKDPFNIIKLQDTFETVIKDNNLEVGSGDLVVFLYFDDSMALTDDNPYSFYEYKKFRSFAQQEIKRAFVNIYRFDTAFAPTAVEIATHELLHLYGANDKYEEKNPERICSPKGRGTPETQVYIPQTTGDIMCSYVEYEEDKFKRGDFFGGDLIINSLTAKEIGWLETVF